MTRYAVRRRKCGCLVSSLPCRDQATAQIGATHTHPNGDVTTVMPLDQAARVPEFCSDADRRSRARAIAAQSAQAGLFA